MVRFWILILGAMLLTLGGGVASAASGSWQGEEGIFRARLITALDSVPADSAPDSGDAPIEIIGGLDVELQEGWKIYWRSPGVAGLPPSLDFSPSADVLDHEIDFPAPKRFSILGFESFGYDTKVVYPLTLSLKPRRDVAIEAILTGLVCSDICIPIEEVLTLNLPLSVDNEVGEQARDIAFFASQVPRQATARGVEVNRLEVEDDGLYLSFAKEGQALGFTAGDIMVEPPPEYNSGYSFSAPVLRRDGVYLESTGKPATDLVGQEVTITAVTPSWLLEARHEINPPSTSDSQSLFSNLLLPAILAAFLGGVILNVMPCVLPVISLKLASVLGIAKEERGVVRRSFVITALGVLVSFLVLGAGLALLRQAGVAVGWGIQFQNPIFLITAAGLIAVFGLILLDVINVPVPAFASNLTSRHGGGNGIYGAGIYKDFFSGFMATLLATPCSAPFVGTALTFAFTSPLPSMMLIFFAMGLGLASPWLIIAVMPQLAGLLPRSGGWLIHLKRVLALGLFATSLWLLSIWAFPDGLTRDDGRWQAWQAGQAEQLAKEGRVVLVDVTAEWCLTCKANKLLVLESDAIKEAFADYDVVLLKADWTEPDAEISRYLAANGRFGIPFNVVHGPSSAQGIILPELLTVDSVLDALATASEGS